MLMALAGLPEPKVDVRQHDTHGNLLGRYELAYEEYRLVIEYDGRQHAEDDVQWQTDLDRREELDFQKARLVVVRSTGLWVEPEVTLRRIVATMQDVVMPVPPLSDAWRAQFPGRPGRRST